MAVVVLSVRRRRRLNGATTNSERSRSQRLSHCESEFIKIDRFEVICPSLFITYIIIVHDKRHDVYVLTSDYGRLVCHSEGLLFPKQMVSFEKISRWRWGYFKSLESSLSQAVGLSPPGPNPSVCLCWKGQEKREAPLILSRVWYGTIWYRTIPYIDSSRRGEESSSRGGEVRGRC